MSNDTCNDPTNYSNTFGTTSPESILNTANKIIYGDREKTYGHPAKNLRTIASYWQTHLEAKGIQFITELTTDDVCVMMILLKQARLANDPTHKDSQVDTCGYAALMERCQDYEKNSTQVDIAVDVALVMPAAPT